MANSWICNPILFSETALNGSFTQFNFDFLNLLWGKTLNAVSTFYNHISHILCMRTRKQMSRIATERIITMMKNAKIIWDRAMGQKPGNSVSFINAAFITKLSIIIQTCFCCPIPTIIRPKFVDFIPEATFQRAIKLIGFHRLKSIFAIAANNRFSISGHILYIPQTL